MPWVRVEKSDYFVNQHGEVRNPKGIVSKPASGRVGIYKGNNKYDYYTIKNYYIKSILGVGAVLKTKLPKPLQDEIWKEYPLDNKYLVSNRGRAFIKRYLSKAGRRGGFILESYLDNDGYVHCSLGKMHRLVYITFNGDLAKTDNVLHKNGITIDNTPENLKKGSAYNNHQDRRKHLTQFIGETSPSAIMTIKLASEIRRHKLFKQGKFKKLAIKYNINPWNISNLQNPDRYSERKLNLMKKSLAKQVRNELKRRILPKECLIDYLKRFKVWGNVPIDLLEGVKNYVPKWKDIYASPGVDLYMERRRTGKRRVFKRDYYSDL